MLFAIAALTIVPSITASGSSFDLNSDGSVNSADLILLMHQILGIDTDGDGYLPEDDCDVSNASIYPGAPEVCDGLDNNCDGMVDDGNPGGGAACNTGQPGVCAAGTTSCQGGVLSCTQNTAPSPEVCDGLDNNCDGAVDEGCP